jgi:hypothetical protein
MQHFAMQSSRDDSMKTQLRCRKSRITKHNTLDTVVGADKAQQLEHAVTNDPKKAQTVR